MTDNTETTEGAGGEPIAGTSLTIIIEYHETAVALRDLQHRFKGLVVDVSTPKGLKEAKACTFELRKLRTGLEAKRKDLKAPILERGKLLDEEARRITSEIVALEEPIDIQIKTEEARIQNEELQRLEALRLRNVAIQDRIQAMRDLPASAAGKPAIIIATKLSELQKTELLEDDFGEHYQTALDARDAVIGRLTTMVTAQRQHEAEQAQIKADREELERVRANNERLQREADERAQADRAEQDRITQVERDRVAAEERAQREADQAERDRIEAEERGERMRLAAEERDRVAAERKQVEAEQQAERERQAETQRQLDAQAEQLRKDKAAAAKKAEADRLASLGLREAAQAIVDRFNTPGVSFSMIVPLINDLAAALANDAAPAKPARGKKAASA